MKKIELREFAEKINIIIDLFNKQKEISLTDLQIVFEGDDWLIMMAMLAMMSEKPKSPMKHITTEQISEISESYICVQCGKPIRRGEDYFLFDIIGCFCECCNNQIKEEPKEQKHEAGEVEIGSTIPQRHTTL